MHNLWKAYAREASKPTFGSARLQLRTGNRWNTSLATVEDRSRDLEIGKAIFQEYTPDKRYVLARNITSDILVSIYDVNIASGMLLRPSLPLKKHQVHEIAGRTGRFQNIEVRLIGLQNGAIDLGPTVSEIEKAVGGALIEADLFGNEVRNIAIDLKTGSSYELLLNNKVYGPAERINKENPEEFAKRKSELAFV